ncbi:MAG: excisionase family DNA-binding protein [Leucobacter sp.]
MTDDVTTRLPGALAAEAKLRQELDAAENATDSLIREARAAGIGWQRLAELTGVDERRLQYRARRHQVTEGDRAERRVSPSERQSRAGVPQHVQDAPEGTVTIAEAARRLDRARLTIYRMIERGELEAIEYGGRQRVTLESLGEAMVDTAGTLSVAEAAHQLGVTPDTVRRWADAGTLEYATLADSSHPKRIVEAGVRQRLDSADMSLVRLSDAAEILGVSRMQAYRLADRGVLDEVEAPSGVRMVTRASVNAERDRRAQQAPM